MSKLNINKVVLESNPSFQFCLNSQYERQLCYDPNHLEAICKMFPITLMKLVRMKVDILHSLLEKISDEDFHVIYLVRDPRGTMSSRWNKSKIKWCKGKDCESEDIVCEDMDDDLTAIYGLKLIYPDRVHIIRYEDIAMNPQYMVSKLVQVLGMNAHEDMWTFIDEHTTVEMPMRKTYRVSKDRVTAWSKEMLKPKLDKVQKSCSKVMKRYGYYPVYDGNYTIQNVMGAMLGAIS